MHISSFQLSNYKSYYQSEPLALSAGVNLIVGPNHAGKTALLEGLRLDFDFNPYRSSKLHKRTEPKDEIVSSAKVSFTLSHEELWDILSNLRGHFGVPLTSGLLHRIQLDDNQDVRQAQRFVNRVFSKESYTLDAFYSRASSTHGHAQLSPAKFPSFGGYDAVEKGGKSPFAWCQLNDEGQLMVVDTQIEGDQKFDVGGQVLDVLKERLYKFKAERFNVGKYVAGLGRRLESDARNLPEVLGNLHGETPAKFRLLNRHFQTIFPQIHEVSARNVQGEQQMGLSREIIIYEVESADPEDAIPLNHGGTGLSQVLAMLYVLVESKHPQVIIIDEPQSFLHPGAVRKLFEIFNLYPQHQYIISTHLPYIIHAAKPTTITLVTKERGQQSRLQSIDVNETQELSICFDQVGARLSDAYGADNILWVEGSTERDCFPMILEKYSQQRLMGTEVVPVISVDEVLGKSTDKVIEIYRRLSQGKGLCPPAIGFIFDRECRKKEQRADLERQLDGRIKFIKRRMYENYLLEPEAIVAVLREMPGINKRTVTATKIKRWLEKEIKTSGYLCVLSDEPWIDIVDGAKLLESLFSHFSNQTIAYKKVEHGVKLSKWLLDNDVGDLREIAVLIEGLLDKDTTRHAQLTGLL